MTIGQLDGSVIAGARHNGAEWIGSFGSDDF
jgi:hypothetical protein